MNGHDGIKELRKALKISSGNEAKHIKREEEKEAKKQEEDIAMFLKYKKRAQETTYTHKIILYRMICYCLWLLTEDRNRYNPTAKYKAVFNEGFERAFKE